MLCGAIPIFVLEGEAPQLKYDVIEKRINGNNKAPTKKNVIRKRLNSLQKQVSVDINVIILKLKIHSLDLEHNKNYCICITYCVDIK